MALAGLVIVLVLVVGAAAVVAVGLGRAMRQPDAQRTVGTGTSTRMPAGPVSPGARGTLDPSAIVAAVDPGVVDINTTLGYQNARAAGTGVVLTSTGLVLTNNHVVADATRISATDVGNGRTYQATVVGYDRSEDIAVLRLTGASGLATVTVGNSGAVRVGDPIMAIGNAGGAGGTPAAVTGVVTGLNQSITASDAAGGTSEELVGLIQVAADIESGDSGGPLVDSSGRVIGIDTAASVGFRSRQGGGQGYAIPINKAMGIEKQIAAGQPSATVHIGATAFLGVQTSTGNNRGRAAAAGAPVDGVLSGSPAEQAGLAAGDMIVSLGGNRVDSATTLTTLLDGHHPGDKVSLGWLDAAGNSHTATVVLVNGPVG